MTRIATYLISGPGLVGLGLFLAYAAFEWRGARRTDAMRGEVSPVSFRAWVRKSCQQFRSRLFAIRQRQLETAREKSRVAAVAWAHFLGKLKWWRDSCKIRTCAGCDSDMGYCLCREKPTRRILAKMIRQLAGVSEARANGEPKNEWSDWNRGPAGLRGCGPGAWDIAVRRGEDAE